jgi:hypothetical protein
MREFGVKADNYTIATFVFLELSVIFRVLGCAVYYAMQLAYNAADEPNNFTRWMDENMLSILNVIYAIDTSGLYLRNTAFGFNLCRWCLLTFKGGLVAENLSQS